MTLKFPFKKTLRDRDCLVYLSTGTSLEDNLELSKLLAKLKIAIFFLEKRIQITKFSKISSMKRIFLKSLHLFIAYTRPADER